MATEQELAQALSPAFGIYPKAFRGNTGNPQDAAKLPVDVMRGRTAGLLGLPSDLLNMFQSPKPMEVFGDVQYEPKIKVPYDTEHFLKTLPLKPTSRAGEVAGQAASFVPLNPAPAVRAAKAGVQALGPTASNMAEDFLMRRGLMPTLDVYHGTPHTLPPTERNPLGEFDASKIGTGEGAQAYGHGIYTAEARPVAEGYAKNVKDMASIKKMNEELSRLSKVMEADSKGGYRKFKSNVGEDAAKRYDELIANRNKVSTSVGNLYKADLPDEMIPKMLDYDKHLSEQSPEVQKILLPYQKEIGGSFGTGDQTLKAIAFERRMKGLDDSPAAVAEQLRQMGIPGIKYLDEASRAKGEGTRNFVTFPGEEKNLTILERNAEKSAK